MAPVRLRHEALLKATCTRPTASAYRPSQRPFQTHRLVITAEQWGCVRRLKGVNQAGTHTTYPCAGPPPHQRTMRRPTAPLWPPTSARPKLQLLMVVVAVLMGTAQSTPAPTSPAVRHTSPFHTPCAPCTSVPVIDAPEKACMHLAWDLLPVRGLAIRQAKIRTYLKTAWSGPPSKFSLRP